MSFLYLKDDQRIMDNFIRLDSENIAIEHICCAFSDKKCNDGYELKKRWLKGEFLNDYVFRRIDARAKVFIEYGPAEKGWVPVNAPNYLLINCFWVSGQYKNKGYGKALLQTALDDAIAQGKDGLVTVVGENKFHFMSDTKWLLRQGFVKCDKLKSGFVLLVRKVNDEAINPSFNDTAITGRITDEVGLTAYYSNRCPFTEYYVTNSLVESAKNRGLPLKIIKLSSMEQAQSAPTPGTIFSLYYNGRFVTTDLSVCMDSRFDKVTNWINLP